MLAFVNYFKVNKSTPAFIRLHSIVIMPVLAMVHSWFAALELSPDILVECESTYLGDKRFLNAKCLTSSLSTNVSTNGTYYYPVDHCFYGSFAIMAFFASFIFGIPQLIYNTIEDNYAEDMSSNINAKIPGNNDIEREKTRQEGIAEILISNSSTHWNIFIANICCQILCLFATISYILILDQEMNGLFVSFGFEFFNPTTFSDGTTGQKLIGIEAIVPQLVDCNIGDFGPDGTYINHPTFCTLRFSKPVRKVLLITWFILAVLLVIQIIGLILMALSVMPFTFARK